MHLVTHSTNRPSKEETLLNSIKNKLKDKPEDAKDILQVLIKRKALMIVEKKVLYNDNKINEIVKLTKNSG